MANKHFKKTVTPPVRRSSPKAKSRQLKEDIKWQNIYDKRPPKPKKEKILKPLPNKHYVGKHKETNRPIHIRDEYAYKDLYEAYKQGGDLYKLLKLVGSKTKRQLNKAAAAFIGGTLMGAACAGVADKVFDDDTLDFHKDLFMFTHDNDDGFLMQLKDLIFGEKDTKKDTTLDDVAKEPEFKQQSYSSETQSQAKQSLQDIDLIPQDAVEPVKISNNSKDDLQPHIHKDKIVWTDQDSIYLHNLSENRGETIYTSSLKKYFPKTSDEYLTWQSEDDDIYAGEDIHIHRYGDATYSDRLAHETLEFSDVHEDLAIYFHYSNNYFVYHNLTIPTLDLIEIQDNPYWMKANREYIYYGSYGDCVKLINITSKEIEWSRCGAGSTSHRGAIFGDLISYRSDGFLHVFNFKENKEVFSIPISEYDNYNSAPSSIYQSKIVWTDNLPGETSFNLYMHDLTTNQTVKILNSDSNQTNPMIFDNFIVFEDDRDGNKDIYLINLSKYYDYSRNLIELRNLSISNVFAEDILISALKTGNISLYTFGLDENLAAFSYYPGVLHNLTVADILSGYSTKVSALENYSIYPSYFRLENGMLYTAQKLNGSSNSVLREFDFKANITEDILSVFNYHMDFDVYKDKFLFSGRPSGYNYGLFLYNKSNESLEQLLEGSVGSSSNTRVNLFEDYVTFTKQVNYGNETRVQLWLLNYKTNESRLLNESSDMWGQDSQLNNKYVVFKNHHNSTFFIHDIKANVTREIILYSPYEFLLKDKYFIYSGSGESETVINILDLETNESFTINSGHYYTSLFDQYENKLSFFQKYYVSPDRILTIDLDKYKNFEEFKSVFPKLNLEQDSLEPSFVNEDGNIFNNKENYLNGSNYFKIPDYSRQSINSDYYELPSYTHKVDYDNYSVYQYFFYYPYNEFFDLENHEHDFEGAMVWVDNETHQPFYYALSQHGQWNGYEVSSVDELMAYIEPGSQGMAKDKSQILTKSDNFEELTLDDFVLIDIKNLQDRADQDLDENGTYKSDTDPGQVKAPWLRPEFSDPDNEIRLNQSKIFNDWVYAKVTRAFWQKDFDLEVYNNLGEITNNTIVEILKSYQKNNEFYIQMKYQLPNSGGDEITPGTLDLYFKITPKFEDGQSNYLIEFKQASDPNIEFVEAQVPITSDEIHTFAIKNRFTDKEHPLADGKPITLLINSDDDPEFEKIYRTDNFSASDYWSKVEKSDIISNLSMFPRGYKSIKLLNDQIVYLHNDSFYVYDLKTDLAREFSDMPAGNITRFDAFKTRWDNMVFFTVTDDIYDINATIYAMDFDDFGPQKFSDPQIIYGNMKVFADKYLAWQGFNETKNKTVIKFLEFSEYNYLQNRKIIHEVPNPYDYTHIIQAQPDILFYDNFNFDIRGDKLVYSSDLVSGLSYLVDLQTEQLTNLSELIASDGLPGSNPSVRFPKLGSKGVYFFDNNFTLNMLNLTDFRRHILTDVSQAADINEDVILNLSYTPGHISMFDLKNNLRKTINVTPPSPNAEFSLLDSDRFAFADEDGVHYYDASHPFRHASVAPYQPSFYTAYEHPDNPPNLDVISAEYNRQSRSLDINYSVSDVYGVKSIEIGLERLEGFINNVTLYHKQIDNLTETSEDIKLNLDYSNYFFGEEHTLWINTIDKHGKNSFYSKSFLPEPPVYPSLIPMFNQPRVNQDDFSLVTYSTDFDIEDDLMLYKAGGEYYIKNLTTDDVFKLNNQGIFYSGFYTNTFNIHKAIFMDKSNILFLTNLTNPISINAVYKYDLTTGDKTFLFNPGYFDNDLILNNGKIFWDSKRFQNCIHSTEEDKDFECSDLYCSDYDTDFKVNDKYIAVYQFDEYNVNNRKFILLGLENSEREIFLDKVYNYGSDFPELNHKESFDINDDYLVYSDKYGGDSLNIKLVKLDDKELEREIIIDDSMGYYGDYIKNIEISDDSKEIFFILGHREDGGSIPVEKLGIIDLEKERIAYKTIPGEYSLNVLDSEIASKHYYFSKSGDGETWDFDYNKEKSDLDWEDLDYKFGRSYLKYKFCNLTCGLTAAAAIAAVAGYRKRKAIKESAASLDLKQRASLVYYKLSSWYNRKRLDSLRKKIFGR